MQKHTGTCGYEPLYCENKCGMKVQRRHIGQHKLGECAKRLVACRYCNKEFVFDTLGAHHAKCGRFPVACPHRCETAVLPREDLEVHLKDHCTTHLLSCTFKDAGCRFKVRIAGWRAVAPSLREISQLEALEFTDSSFRGTRYLIFKNVYQFRLTIYYLLICHALVGFLSQGRKALRDDLSVTGK